MKVLVIGSGGREHALAWALARSPRVQHVIVAPGNAGTALEEGVRNDPARTVEEWLALAEREDIGLTVVGPEAALALGVVDAFRAHGRRIFGPTKAAAQLESSKDFAKAFMARHAIPTARYATFSDATLAHQYVEAQGAPIVIKADGLAAGKGVVVAMTLDEAHAAIDAMLAGNAFGSAGARVVIEEFMHGEEASFIVLADGAQALPLATTQDHKRVGDGDNGPNTGGMGAYSPAPVVTPKVHARIMREIIQPTLAGMKAEGLPYSGFLYAGVMIDARGAPRVVEFNCRLGDPETQPILMRLKSDLVDVIEAALDGGLADFEAEWDRRAALAVVLAASNYPGTPRVGDAISGLDNMPDEVKVFHAATVAEGGALCTSGGRVLAVAALGDTLRQAARTAYAGVGQIRFEGMHYRNDIGHRALGALGALSAQGAKR